VHAIGDLGEDSADDIRVDVAAGGLLPLPDDEPVRDVLQQRPRLLGTAPRVAM